VCAEIFAQRDFEKDDPAPGVRKLGEYPRDRVRADTKHRAGSPGRISSGPPHFAWTLQGLSLARLFPTRILPIRTLRRYRDKTGEILKQDRVTLRPDDALRCPLTQQPAYCEQRGSGHLR